MKKNVFMMMLLAGAVLTTSCGSKKELVACQNENRELTTNFQNAKEQLAASQTRVTSLEEQLAAQKKELADQRKHTLVCRKHSTKALPMLLRTTFLLINLWTKSTSRISTSVIWWR